MSRIFKVSTHQKIEIDTLIDTLRKKRIYAFYIDKSPIYHIYEEGFSTRGVEVTDEENGYEIRMTALSSANDFLLCNEIAFTLCKNLNGTLYTEDGDEKYIGTLFNDLEIHNIMQGDYESIVALLKHNESVSISCPIRPFSFGPKIKEKVLALTGNSFTIIKGLSKLILNCQFPPEEYIPYSNFLKVGDDDDFYYVQVLTNSKKMVVENVKQYAVSGSNESSIMVNCDDLIKIVPEEWVFLDDNTLLANPLEPEKWKEFVKRAEAANQAK